MEAFDDPSLQQHDGNTHNITNEHRQLPDTLGDYGGDIDLNGYNDDSESNGDGNEDTDEDRDDYYGYENNDNEDDDENNAQDRNGGEDKDAARENENDETEYNNDHNDGIDEHHVPAENDIGMLLDSLLLRPGGLLTWSTQMRSRPTKTIEMHSGIFKRAHTEKSCILRYAITYQLTIVTTLIFFFYGEFRV